MEAAAVDCFSCGVLAFKSAAILVARSSYSPYAPSVHRSNRLLKFDHPAASAGTAILGVQQLDALKLNGKSLFRLDSGNDAVWKLPLLRAKPLYRQTPLTSAKA